MKLLRIAALAVLAAYGGLTGGATAAPAAGLFTGAPAVRTLATPAISVEKTYYYYRRHYWHRPYWRRHYWYHRPYWRRHYWYRRHYWHPYRHYYHRRYYWHPYYRRHYWHRYYW